MSAPNRAVFKMKPKEQMVVWKHYLHFSTFFILINFGAKACMEPMYSVFFFLK